MADLECNKLAWRVCNGRTIFLDVAGDRYFRLPAERDHEFQAKHKDPWRQPDDIPRPAPWRLPSASYETSSDDSFSLRAVAAALWVQRRIEKRLASRGFEAVLRELQKVRPQAQKADTPSGKLEPIVRSFEQARLLRTSADRCLPGSLALIVSLASARIHADLVIGVRDEPFGAHCWAQQGTVVLNESLEETRRYEPILVV